MADLPTLPKPYLANSIALPERFACELLSPASLARRKFDPGRIVITPAVNDLVERGELDPAAFLSRHLSGDSEDMTARERREYNQALARNNHMGKALISSYDNGGPAGPRVWIITEADRSVTTLMLSTPLPDILLLPLPGYADTHPGSIVLVSHLRRSV